MSDVFREVDEDLRRQRLEELWKKYGSWVIGAAVAFVVVVGASLYWNDAQERKRAKLSDEYAAAVDLIQAGQEEEGLAALGALAEKTGGGYEAISILTQAQILHRQGKIEEAVAAYDKVGKGNLGGPIVSELAQVKAAWALADTASYEDMSARVSALAEGDGVWHYPAQEILAYSAFKSGMTDYARTAYQQIATDLVAPEGLRERAAIMLRVLGPAPVAPAPELSDGTAAAHDHDAHAEEGQEGTDPVAEESASEAEPASESGMEVETDAEPEAASPAESDTTDAAATDDSASAEPTE